MTERKIYGVTIIELLVILAILSILATVAVSNYAPTVARAKNAGCLAEIRVMEEACERYKLDTGQYPPSSSGTQYAPNPLDPIAAGEGCGYMVLALRESLSGDADTPLSGYWRGPYLDPDRDQLGTMDGDALTTAGVELPMVQMLDPWDRPYRYVRYDDYETMNGVLVRATDPYSTAHKFENPYTFQIVSGGADGKMFESAGVLDEDDLTNFSR